MKIERFAWRLLLLWGIVRIAGDLLGRALRLAAFVVAMVLIA